MTELEKQFREMKKGDKIWVDRGRHGWAVHRFQRVTKTLLVTTFKGINDVEYKFSIKNGRQKGTDRWSFNYAEPFKEEHQKIIDAYLLKNRAKDALEQLTKINLKKGLEESFVKILEEYLEKVKPNDFD